MRHLPNLICLLRIALIWPVTVTMVHGEYGACIALFCVAAASDGLDGYLAKRMGWTSELGKLLDPLADKLLLLTVFLTAAWYGLMPQWITAAAVARDVMIGLGALGYRLTSGPLHGHPLDSSKVNTLMQLLYVLAVLAHWGFGLPGWLVAMLSVTTLGTLLISGYAYVSEYTRRALAAARA